MPGRLVDNEREESCRRSSPLSLPPPQIVDLLGQAAFSRAVQALDLKTGALVCLKIIKVRAGVPSRVPRG
jgi:hypothetical protein